MASAKLPIATQSMFFCSSGQGHRRIVAALRASIMPSTCTKWRKSVLFDVCDKEFHFNGNSPLAHPQKRC
jgi:hypothetical protein